MSLELTSMTEERFNQYYKHALKAYADEHVKAGNWKEEEAIQKARQQFEQLLPDGLETKDHHLLSILHDGEPIGILWLRVQSNHQEKQAIIFDIKLDEDQRGKGFGTAAMEAIDEYAQSMGVQQIRLHVFAHNQRAKSLYEKMGYDMTGYQMSKRLS
ncbi:GNAT family N-acetyltransferase [Tuberibacillus sp. Marseille-P3662]|uniref:GNAT family N-acetyltransferase n=1 Tax=Tuberibacillus sp. Marseille-P3662 TaxID=1965358 RepID=UPI000A1CB56B|nr:GNAT family N-acetyltransferase [Tuberibacillus sp. Marseille-P3662]